MNRIGTSAWLLPLAIIPCSAFAADTQPASQPALEPIRYQRTGGFAGTNDVIEITKDGLIVVQGKLMTSGKGQLKPDSMAKLAALFKEWKSLKPGYPTPPGVNDDFTYKIRYGTVEVTGSDLNPQLPATFKAVRNAIEEAARTIIPAG